MCFSAKVSFVTFALGMVLASMLVCSGFPNGVWIGIFLGVVMLVQLLEGIIWRFPEWASTATALILVALWLQPLVQTYMGYWATGYNILGIGVIVFIFTLLYAIYRAITEDFSATTGPNHHLIWGSNADAFVGGEYKLTMLYLAGLLVPLLFMRPLWKGLTLTTYGLATLGWTVYAYRSTGEMSSMWCLLGIGYGVLGLGLVG